MNLIMEDQDDELQLFKGSEISKKNLKERSIQDLVDLLMSNTLMKNKSYVLSDD